MTLSDSEWAKISVICIYFESVVTRKICGVLFQLGIRGSWGSHGIEDKEYCLREHNSV
jgi:hypothetical protein